MSNSEVYHYLSTISCAFWIYYYPQFPQSWNQFIIFVRWHQFFEGLLLLLSKDRSPVLLLLSRDLHVNILILRQNVLVVSCTRVVLNISFRSWLSVACNFDSSRFSSLQRFFFVRFFFFFLVLSESSLLLSHLLRLLLFFRVSEPF